MLLVVTLIKVQSISSSFILSLQVDPYIKTLWQFFTSVELETRLHNYFISSWHQFIPIWKVLSHSNESKPNLSCNDNTGIAQCPHYSKWSIALTRVESALPSKISFFYPARIQSEYKLIIWSRHQVNYSYLSYRGDSLVLWRNKYLKLV